MSIDQVEGRPSDTSDAGAALRRCIEAAARELDERWNVLAFEHRERLAATVDHLTRAHASMPAPPALTVERVVAAVWHAIQDEAPVSTEVADAVVARLREQLRT